MAPIRCQSFSSPAWACLCVSGNRDIVERTKARNEETRKGTKETTNVATLTLSTTSGSFQTQRKPPRYFLASSNIVLNDSIVRFSIKGDREQCQVHFCPFVSNFRDVVRAKMAEQETKNEPGTSKKDFKSPVKDSVLEMRTRMSRLMSIVEITPHNRFPVPA